MLGLVKLDTGLTTKSELMNDLHVRRINTGKSDMSRIPSYSIMADLIYPFHLPDGTCPVRAMDPVNLPVVGIPGRDTQCNPSVIKFQDMLESIANILRLPVGYRIDKSIADIVEALAGLLYALDLDFAKVVRKFPVISIREIPGINVEIGFSLVLFFHQLFPHYPSLYFSVMRCRTHPIVSCQSIS